MRTTFLKGVALGAVVSGVTLISSIALAGTGVGGVFNLGQANTVNASTTLTGSTKGAQLQVTNTNTGAKAAGVRINVPPGAPPLRVNSSTQVANLNASYVGGVPATGLVQGTGSIHGGSLNVPTGGFTGLGGVGNFGGLTAYCAAGGFTDAGIQLDATEAQVVKVWSASTGLNFYSIGANTLLNVGADSGQAMETVQFSSGGTEVATATLTWGFSTGPGCDFSVQVVDSTG